MLASDPSAWPSRPFGPAVVALVLLLVACSDDSDPVDPGDPDDTDPPPGEAVLECERHGYPCSAADVDPTVVEATMALQQHVVDEHGAGRDMASLRDEVADKEDVVEVAGNGDLMWFRLEGGRPAWVVGEEALITADIEGGGSGPTAVESPAGDGATPPTSRQVVRRDPSSFEPKHALVLAPFAWETSHIDGTWVADHMNAVRGYRPQDGGTVTLLQNEEVDLSAFQGWSGYDVIHVNTHGGGGCVEEHDRCLLTLATGIEVEDPEDYTFSEDPTDLIQFSISGKALGGRRFVSVTNDFFALRYPQGLDRSFIFLNACHSHRVEPDESASPSFAEILVGENSEYAGWTNTVAVGDAIQARNFLYEYLTGHAVTTERAYESLEDAGLSSFIHDEEGPVQLRLRGRHEVRLREIIVMKNILRGEEMEDEDETPVVGEPGDGQDDKLPILLTLDGVHPGEEAAYEVTIEVDGTEIDAGTPEDEDWSRLGEYSYRFRRNEDLEFDTRQHQELDVRVETTLHEGIGDSHHEVVPIVANPVLELSSEMDGFHEGGDYRTDLVMTIEAEFDLEMRDDTARVIFDGAGEVSYDVDWFGTAGSCTIRDIDAHEGAVFVRAVEFPIDPSSADFGVPETMRLGFDEDTYEVLEVECPEGSGSGEFRGWIRHFGEAHEERFEPNDFCWACFFVFEDWESGIGDEYGRLEFDRTFVIPSPEDHAEAHEETIIKLRPPDGP